MVFVDAGKFVIFIIEGKSHDAGILRRSHLLDELERNCNTEYGDPLCIYGDSAYPERMHLQTPYKGNNLTNDQKAFNTAMSKVRVSVEWVFGEIAGYFAFIDLKKIKNWIAASWNNVHYLCFIEECHFMLIWVYNQDIL